MARCSAHMYAFGGVLQVLDFTVQAEARGPVYYMNIPNARITNSVQKGNGMTCSGLCLILHLLFCSCSFPMKF
jgi:hypothetical protein